MGRAPCCDKANVKKGPWSPQEDAKLKDYIEKHGTGGNWITLPKKVGLIRCGKSCRLRWLNYLRPNIRHGKFSDLEDQIICTLFASIGSRWSIIASHLEGRTDNDVKNYWNTKLKKKIMANINHSIEMKAQQITLLPYQSQESFTGSYSYSSTSSLLSGNSSTSAAQESFNIGPTEKCQLFKDINVIDQELVAKCGDINYLYNDVEHSEKLMFSNNENGLWGENTLDYGLDEINKEIISTDISSCKKYLFDD